MRTLYILNKIRVYTSTQKKGEEKLSKTLFTTKLFSFFFSACSALFIVSFCVASPSLYVLFILIVDMKV